MGVVEGVFKAVDAALTVAGYVQKGVSIVEAGSEIYKASQKTELSTTDKFHIGFQAAFIVSQTADLVGNDMGLLPSEYTKTSLGIRGGAGVADVGRKVAKKEASGKPWEKDDYLEIAATAASRTGDFASFTATRHPHVLGEYTPYVKTGAKAFTLTGAGIAQRENIIWIGRYVRGRFIPNDGGDNNNSTDNTQQQTGGGGAGVVSGQTGEELSRAQQIVAFKNNPLACKSIPEFLINKGSWTYKCAITGKPVRHILIPVLPDEALEEKPDLVSLCYERAVIEEWLRTNTNTTNVPRGWPQEYLTTPVTMNQLAFDRRVQLTIDQQLKALARTDLS